MSLNFIFSDFDLDLLQDIQARSEAKLYLGNLSSTVSEKHLRYAFSAFGTILELNVFPSHKKSLSYGNIVFSSAEEAREAQDVSLSESRVARLFD